MYTVKGKQPRSTIKYKIVREKAMGRYHRKPDDQRWADLVHKGKDGRWRKVQRYDSADEALSALIVKMGYGDTLQG